MASLLVFALLLALLVGTFALHGLDRRREPLHAAVDIPASDARYLDGWIEIESTMGKECLIVISDRQSAQHAEGKVLLWYEGAPGEAELTLTSCGVNPGQEHTIYLNGSPVARARDDSYCTCICSGQPRGGLQYRSVTYRIDDPSAIVNGWNYISITNDADVADTWMAYDLQLVIRGKLAKALVEEFAFISSYDGSLRRAVYQVPVGFDFTSPAPLLISIGGTLEDRWDALSRFTHRANVRGWLLLAPDIRGVRGDSLGRSASLATQHDILDAINYLKNRFQVDSDRIYMSGFSSGGGIAATVAAKYPDVFAAVVAWKAPLSLLEWVQQRPDLTWTLTTYDVGCPPQGGSAACPFEWQRRSARELVMNLKHVPMAIVHGRADTRVPFSQSEGFYSDMATFYDPATNNKLAIWHDGGHVDWLPTFEGLDFMAQYTLNRNPTEIMIRTDESKAYYWVRISQLAWRGKQVDGFSRVMADYDVASQTISVWIWDERVLDIKTLPLEVTFDLQKMGLDPHASYTVKDHHPASGATTVWPDVSPVAGQLTLSVPRELVGQERHHFLIYPSNPAPDGARSSVAPHGDTMVLASARPERDGLVPHRAEGWAIP